MRSISNTIKNKWEFTAEEKQLEAGSMAVEWKYSKDMKNSC